MNIEDEFDFVTIGKVFFKQLIITDDFKIMREGLVVGYTTDDGDGDNSGRNVIIKYENSWYRVIDKIHLFHDSNYLKTLRTVYGDYYVNEFDTLLDKIYEQEPKHIFVV